MNKIVLIPTDFTIESLNLVKHALKVSEQQEVCVLFMYSCHLTDSITELIFYSPTKIISKATNSTFEEACNILISKYASQLSWIHTKLFHGINVNAFKNFAEANKISEVFIPKNYKLRLQDESFDPIYLIKASKIKYTEVDWKSKNDLPEKDKLAELFAE